MRTSVSLAASLTLLVLASTAPAQAGSSYGCHSCEPTFMTILINSGSHSIPFPTRNGNYVGHFDAAGVPQSIIAPAESHQEIIEVPCTPVVRKYSGGS